ncbi:uncharacterized protein LOC119083424 [Bradysia coprophila]|uniref:uncharacterized protein LOC119083424 n=1 Tax=Bradysia coprophila TaxID=38358 RepID=UPI00187D7A09|nr:uncharacterized protein LOC119083424 [Bradysia coprophila]
MDSEIIELMDSWVQAVGQLSVEKKDIERRMNRSIIGTAAVGTYEQYLRLKDQYDRIVKATDAMLFDALRLERLEAEIDKAIDKLTDNLDRQRALLPKKERATRQLFTDNST